MWKCRGMSLKRSRVAQRMGKWCGGYTCGGSTRHVGGSTRWSGRVLDSRGGYRARMPNGEGLDSSIILHWKADACQYWLIFSVVMIGAGGFYWHLVGRGQACCSIPNNSETSSLKNEWSGWRCQER